MTTFAEEVTHHLELFIKHLTDNNEVIDEYNEEFLVDATIISLKSRGTIQSHLEETNARLIFYTYIREYKQQQFYIFMQINSHHQVLKINFQYMKTCEA
jgi:hypothetical protein